MKTALQVHVPNVHNGTCVTLADTDNGKINQISYINILECGQPHDSTINCNEELSVYFDQAIIKYMCKNNNHIHSQL